jgi:hypothetical protein
LIFENARELRDAAGDTVGDWEVVGGGSKGTRYWVFFSDMVEMGVKIQRKEVNE